jgi:hypothetical protein
MFSPNKAFDWEFHRKDKILNKQKLSAFIKDSVKGSFQNQKPAKLGEGV